jgi:hypothetical protein
MSKLTGMWVSVFDGKDSAQDGQVIDEIGTDFSPTGSLHYYFKYPEGVTIINSDSKLATGVDVRAEGGMVLAPPSVKPDVGTYKWISEADIADAPQWLIDRLVKQTQESESKSDPQASLDRIAKAMEAMPNIYQGHKFWKDMGIRIFAAGAPFQIFDKWSQKCPTKYNAAETKQAWQEITNSPPDRTGAGAIFKMADELAPGWDAHAQSLSTTTWRERSKGGIPIASMHNARVAITALGIECSHDIFHNKMLFGFRGDAVRYNLGGEMSDIHLVDGQERVATSDLMENVLQIHPSQQTTGYAMRLKNAMKRLGWQRDGENKITINGKQVRGYYRPVQKSVPPIHVIDMGEETPIADNFKAHGFKEVSHREFVNTKQYEKMGDLAPTVQTNSMLIKNEPELPPELLALINTPSSQQHWEWEPFYRPRKRFRHRAKRKVLRTARANS